MDKSQEQVLVVPTAVFHALGVFQGFSPRADHYISKLLDPANLSYRPRGLMEADPSFKQIIPYVVLQWRDQAFHYTRGKGGGEARLHAKRSIGVGGHISAEDQTLFDSPYAEALAREVAEEVDIGTTYQERCIGLLNDDSTPVGAVHLGIVHVFTLAEPKVERREKVLTRAGFASLAELRRERAEFETWSQFVLDVLPDGP